MITRVRSVALRNRYHLNQLPSISFTPVASLIFSIEGTVKMKEYLSLVKDVSKAVRHSGVLQGHFRILAEQEGTQTTLVLPGTLRTI